MSSGELLYRKQYINYTIGCGIVTYDEVQKTGKFFELGNIFHMNRKENVEVNLAKQSFASHIGEIQGEMFKELYE